MTEYDKHGRPVVTMIGKAGRIVVLEEQRKALEAQGYEVEVKIISPKRKRKKSAKAEE